MKLFFKIIFFCLLNLGIAYVFALSTGVLIIGYLCGMSTNNSWLCVNGSLIAYGGFILIHLLINILWIFPFKKYHAVIAILNCVYIIALYVILTPLASTGG